MVALTTVVTLLEAEIKLLLIRSRAASIDFELLPCKGSLETKLHLERSYSRKLREFIDLILCPLTDYLKFQVQPNNHRATFPEFFRRAYQFVVEMEKRVGKCRIRLRMC